MAKKSLAHSFDSCRFRVRHRALRLGVRGQQRFLRKLRRRWQRTAAPRREAPFRSAARRARRRSAARPARPARHRSAAASGTTGSSGSAGSSTGGADWCGTGGCICNNGLDDDGDGLIDGLDPECTGPLDNDEGTFSTGIPGDNRDPKWQDCFFDGNSGAGDDRCRYATECLYGTLSQDDPDCETSQACIDYCRRLTPNGCDCFGCCTVQERRRDRNRTCSSAAPARSPSSTTRRSARAARRPPIAATTAASASSARARPSPIFRTAARRHRPTAARPTAARPRPRTPATTAKSCAAPKSPAPASTTARSAAACPSSADTNAARLEAARATVPPSLTSRAVIP